MPSTTWSAVASTRTRSWPCSRRPASSAKSSATSARKAACFSRWGRLWACRIRLGSWASAGPWNGTAIVLSTASRRGPGWQAEWSFLLLSQPSAPMRRSLSQFRFGESAAIHGQVWIAAGLSILLAAAWWPMLPAVTGMALITLGATGTTIARFCGRPALAPVLFVHLAVYGGLYALVVGATLHAGSQASGGVGLAGGGGP